MRKTLLATILATVAFTPLAAAAQERPMRGMFQDDGGVRPERERQDTPAPAQQQERREYRAARQQAAPAPAPAETQVAQRQPGQWGGNRDGGRRNWSNGDNRASGGWNRGDRGQVQPQQAAPPVAQAQPQRDDRGARRSFDGSGNRGFEGNRGWNGNRSFDANRGQYDPRPQQSQNRDRTWDRSPGWTSNRDWTGNRGWTGNDRRPEYNRNWRNNDRYDWQRYRNSHRQTYRLPRYYAPHGWDYGYRRFSIGAYLDEALFAQSYWIGDPYDYRLPPVEWPYRWVRYYNDALLVDTETGEVVDVISDIFW